MVTSNGLTTAQVPNPPPSVPSTSYPVYSLGDIGAGGRATISVALQVQQSMNEIISGKLHDASYAQLNWSYASRPVSPVPEPATVSLLITGLAGVAVASRRRRPA